MAGPLLQGYKTNPGTGGIIGKQGRQKSMRGQYLVDKSVSIRNDVS